MSSGRGGASPRHLEVRHARVPARTVPIGYRIARAGPSTPDNRPRTTHLGSAGALAVVLATLIPVLAPVPAAAVVPATNGPIAFTSDRNGNNEIYVMNADGTNQTRPLERGLRPYAYS